MKIFYLTRLFSGLESSFLTKRWSPTGVPTIYKIVEKIDVENDTCFVFTAKDSGAGYFSSWSESKDKLLSIDGLNHDINIISGINYFPAWVNTKIRVIFREIRQTIVILYKIYKFKPNILYCDHANVIIAAIFSRVQKDIPVVFRVMGVNKLMRASTSGFKVYHYIYRWAYRSPFSLVVCTQDGSGVEKWASQVLSTRSRVEIFINGTDDLSLDGNIDSILKNLPHNRVIIMFVGKLEKYKGCYEFVEAILNLVANKMTNIHALIIGSGTEEKKIVELVNNAGASIFFTFIKLLSHSQILHAHSICDIYVSMNHLGNLSNANLEAIQSNDCIIIPKPQQDNGIDKVTASLLGNSIISVPIKQPDELSNALSILIRSKSKRKIMEGRIKAIKKNFIWSWNERIKAELDIIKDLKNSHNLNE